MFKTICALVALLTLANTASAHGGEDHGDQPVAAMAGATASAEATSERYEAVIRIVEDGKRVDEGLIVSRTGAARDGQRLTMCFGAELWRAHVRHPDLDRAQPLLAQTRTVLPNLLSRLRGDGCGRHGRLSGRVPPTAIHPDRSGSASICQTRSKPEHDNSVWRYAMGRKQTRLELHVT